MSDIIVYDIEGNSKNIYANDLVKNEEVNLENWICGIGLESIEIKSNGDIYRGTCRVGGKIGHIDDDIWVLPNNFINCTKNQCTCVADLKSTRYKTLEIKEKLASSIKKEILNQNGDENSINF